MGPKELLEDFFVSNEPFAKSKESHARLDLPWASHRWHRWRCGAFAPCVR
jgi:hypothetical protein